MQGWLLLWVPDWGPPTLPWRLCLPCWFLHLHWPRAAVSTLPYLGESETPPNPISASRLSRQESTIQCPKGCRARNQDGVHLALASQLLLLSREEDKEANCTERPFGSLLGNPVLGSQI